MHNTDVVRRKSFTNVSFEPSKLPASLGSCGKEAFDTSRSNRHSRANRNDGSIKLRRSLSESYTIDSSENKVKNDVWINTLRSRYLHLKPESLYTNKGVENNSRKSYTYGDREVRRAASRSSLLQVSIQDKLKENTFSQRSYARNSSNDRNWRSPDEPNKQQSNPSRITTLSPLRVEVDCTYSRKQQRVPRKYHCRGSSQDSNDS